MCPAVAETTKNIFGAAKSPASHEIAGEPMFPDSSRHSRVVTAAKTNGTEDGKAGADKKETGVKHSLEGLVKIASMVEYGGKVLVKVAVEANLA